MKKLFRKLFPDKEMRAFRKMHRRHRKELIKHAKKTGEWDWSWLHESVIMQIEHMYEYYSAGNNVWQTNETRLPIIEELKHILDRDAEIEHLESDELGLEWIEKEGKIEYVCPEGYIEKLAKHEKMIAEAYAEIYNSIGKNLRNWWD